MLQYDAILKGRFLTIELNPVSLNGTPVSICIILYASGTNQTILRLIGTTLTMWFKYNYIEIKCFIRLISV